MDSGIKQAIMFILGGMYIGSLWLAMSIDTIFYVPFSIATFFLLGFTINNLIANW